MNRCITSVGCAVEGRFLKSKNGKPDKLDGDYRVREGISI
jgi:hypothetical protein